MQTKSLKPFVLAVLAALAVALSPTAFAQGVVSSGITGSLIDSGGKPVAGATVTIVHTPTNTTYTAITNASGRFKVTGLRVGGPYSVSATAGTQNVQPLQDVQTSLGEDTDVQLIARDEVLQLEKYVVSGETNALDANATGTSSVLSNSRIGLQPTVNRSFADLARTNPFVSIRASQQIQALGTNSRYNNIMLDGAKINDSFGLSSSGLFSITNPFSVDAIEQVNISLTPYDVTQSGSTGVHMNVVSKSGTNEFHGSTYYIYTNQNWQGKDLTGTNMGLRSPYKERFYGFTLGGPIIPNRLFFFINFEKDITDVAPTTPSFIPAQSFLDAVTARAALLPGKPDLGTFGGTSSTRTADQKRLAKIDWNITADHRLSVRYSDTVDGRTSTGALRATTYSGTNPTGTPTLSNTSTALSSNFFTIPSEEKVWAGQLFSNWSPNLKTQLRYSDTKQNGLRQTPINFPEIRIFSVPDQAGANPAGDGTGITMGTEVSSMGNGVVTATKTMGGSADYTWKTFTFTAGADNEKSDFTNYFRQGSYGVFTYKNLADFQADQPFGFYRAVVLNGTSTADISSFEQTGVFAQARWEPNARLNATLGLRVDFPDTPLDVPTNALFESAFGMKNTGTIGGTTNPAPRFSFNYALDDKRMTQVRGGYGIFLGRNPWVWISNSYGNFGTVRYTILNQMPTGTTFNTIDTSKYTGPTLTQYLNGTFSNADIAYKFDPTDPIGKSNVPSSGAQVVNLMKPGLRLPTVARGNLAIDQKIPGLDAVFSVEYIDTKQISALFIDNMNLRPTTVGIDGRQRFAGSASSAPRVAGFGDVLRIRNVHAGASQAVSLSLNREMKNTWGYTFAYTHAHATEAQTLNSSTAGSNWRFNPTFNQNAVEVYRSDYEVTDRIQINLSKEFRFKKDFVTTVSLYYEGRTGMPFSYVYNNDMNTDGFVANDLIAVPLNDSDSRFDFGSLSATQKSAYFDFIKNSGLGKYAGGYAPRNAFSTPWQNRLDLRFVQDLPVGHLPGIRKLKMQVFADFLNFGSWLNKDLFNYIDLINASSVTNGGQTRSFGAATYDATTGKIKPTFNDGSTTVLSLNTDNQVVFGANVPAATSTSSSVIRPNNSESRWKIQFGVKLAF